MKTNSENFPGEKFHSQEEGREISRVGRYYQQVSHLSNLELASVIRRDIRRMMDAEPIYDGEFGVKISKSKDKKLNVTIRYVGEEIIDQDFIKKLIREDAPQGKDFLERNYKKIFTQFAFEFQDRITRVLNNYNRRLYKASEGKMILLSEHFSSRICFNRSYIKYLINPLPESMIDDADKNGKFHSMIFSPKKYEKESIANDENHERANC